MGWLAIAGIALVLIVAVVVIFAFLSIMAEGFKH